MSESCFECGSEVSDGVFNLMKFTGFAKDGDVFYKCGRMKGDTRKRPACAYHKEINRQKRLIHLLYEHYKQACENDYSSQPMELSQFDELLD